MVNTLAAVDATATPSLLWTLGIAIVVAFALLAGYDGVNLHLVRYRLWARPESRHEHLVHTARAIAFPIALVLVFTGRGGPILWAGLAVIVIDTAFEVYDVAIEPDSRARAGGLPVAEGVLHNILGTLRAAAIVLVLVARPTEAYRWSDAIDLAVPIWSNLIIYGFVVSGTVTAVAHVWLATRPLDPTEPAAPAAVPSDRHLMETR